MGHSRDEREEVGGDYSTATCVLVVKNSYRSFHLLVDNEHIFIDARAHICTSKLHEQTHQQHAPFQPMQPVLFCTRDTANGETRLWIPRSASELKSPEFWALISVDEPLRW